MRSRLLSIAGIVVFVVAGAAWLLAAGNSEDGISGEEWRPVSADPSMVVVWGEAWSYAEVDAVRNSDSLEPEPLFTDRRPPPHDIILVPVDGLPAVSDFIQASHLREGRHAEAREKKSGGRIGRGPRERGTESARTKKESGAQNKSGSWDAYEGGLPPV